MCRDALEREESCGCHFREEFQTPDGEAQRDDEHFCYVSAWEYAGEQASPYCTKNLWSLNMCHRRNGVTSNEPDASRLATKNMSAEGKMVRYEAGGHQSQTCLSLRCWTLSTGS